MLLFVECNHEKLWVLSQHKWKALKKMCFWLNLIWPITPWNLGPVIGSNHGFKAIPKVFRVHLDNDHITGWASGSRVKRHTSTQTNQKMRCSEVQWGAVRTEYWGLFLFFRPPPFFFNFLISNIELVLHIQVITMSYLNWGHLLIAYLIVIVASF